MLLMSHINIVNNNHSQTIHCICIIHAINKKQKLRVIEGFSTLSTGSTLLIPKVVDKLEFQAGRDSKYQLLYRQ
ncbi:hypothetical protein OROGR_032010 [Orobanche gracilis]